MVTIGIVVTCAIATWVATKIALTPSASPEPIVAPKLAAPMVIPITTPQPIVVQVPAPAPPIPVVIDEEPPPPRATFPVIRAECLTPIPEDGETRDSCLWDGGFPAISADGSTIVTADNKGDEPDGTPGLSIRFLDAATGKRLKELLVLSPEEYVTPAQEEAIEKQYRAMLKKVDRRSAAVQKLLDDGRYHSLTWLGTAPVDGLAAEVEGDAVRVIDRTANTVLWQRRFAVATEFPNRTLDGERCEPIDVSDISIAWDAPTRTLVAEVAYRQGPEFCGRDTQRDYVVQVRR
jgi:hypothetical protein